MNSVVEGKVRMFLRTRFNFRPYDIDRAIAHMNALSRVAGYGLNPYFGRAGLAVGPNAFVAAGIVNRALGGGGGSPVSDEIIKGTLARWLRTGRRPRG